MKRLLPFLIAFLSAMSLMAQTNSYKWLELKNVDTTAFTNSDGRFWYNPTVHKFTFMENGVVKHIGSGTGGGLTSFTSGNLSPLFTTSLGGSPTTSPALTFSLSTQTANIVFAGPSSGGAAGPTFRALVATDIPSLSYATNTAANNEIPKSNGSTGLGTSSIFSTSAGNLILGSSGASGSHSISAASSDTNTDLSLSPQAAGTVIINGSQTIRAGTNSLNLRSVSGNTVNIGDGSNDFRVFEDAVLSRTIIGRSPAGGILQIQSNASVVSSGTTGSILFDITAPTGGGAYGNYAYNVATLPSFGGGEKVFFFGPAITNPSTAVSSGGVFFVKSSDNLPYWRTASTEYPMTGGGGGGTNPGLNLAPTAVKTSSYTAAVADLVLTDASGGTVPITLPTAPADKSTIAVKMVTTNAAGTNTTTVTTGGTDVFNQGSATVATLSLLAQAQTYQYKTGSPGRWYVVSDDEPLSQLDARFASRHPAVNHQTASYTLVLTDDQLTVEMDNTSPTNLTIPPNASVALPVGTLIVIKQYNTGAVTIVLGTAVTGRSSSIGTNQTSGAFTSTTGKNTLIVIKQRAVDDWDIDDGLPGSSAVTSVTGSASITSTGTTAPVLSINTSWPGQTGITTFGTITTGTLGSGAKILVGSDATGDIYYNGGSGAITRLGIGATSKMMTVVSGLPAWSAYTLAAPGTSGNLLQSDGTNWTSVAASSSGAWTTLSGATLTGPNTITGTTTNTLKFLFDGLATAITPDGAGLWLKNSTAATSGATIQNSPILTFDGTNWDGATTRGNTWRVQNVPIPNGATSQGQLVFSYYFDGTIKDNALKIVGTNGGNAGYIDIASGTLRNSAGAIALQSGTITRLVLAVTTGNATWTQSASTTGVGPAQTFNFGAHTALTASTINNAFITSAVTRQYSTGALSNQALINFRSETIAFVGASTATNPTTVQIDAPTPGTNANAFVNPSALTLNGHLWFKTGGTVFGIVGSATNDNAVAGNMGEAVQSLIATGSAVSLTTATAANVTSISLTAGDWDVYGIVNYTETTSTVTARSASISTTSATLATDGSEGNNGVQSTVTSEVNSITPMSVRISISGTTTVYLVAKATFSAGTAAAYGGIRARRIR